MRQNFCNQCRKFRSLIATVDEQRLQKGKHTEQCRHDENASIAILNVGRMNDGVEQEAQCVDKNVPLLALDLLARIVPVRINERPPFSALFTLWLSMMAAVGLASRCSRSRHCSSRASWILPYVPSSSHISKWSTTALLDRLTFG